MVQAFQEVEHLHPGALIQVAGGLVGEQQGRASGESAGQDCALLLTTGELAGPVVAAIGKPDFLKLGGGRIGGLAPGSAADEQRHHDVFESGELGQEGVHLPDKTDMAVAPFGNSR